MRKILIAVLFSTLAFSADNSLMLNLNDADIEGGYERNKQISQSSSLYYGFELLNGEDEFDKSHLMISGHFKIMGLTPVAGLAASIGMKAATARIYRKNIVALPVEAGIIYTLPLAIKSHVLGSIGYSPKSLCVSNCDRFTEYRIEAGIEPIEGGLVFVGYRDIEIRAKNSSTDFEFNKAAYIGLRMSF